MSNTEHVQTGFAEINGTTLYYEVAGVGHPFVLLHGHLLVDDRGTISSQPLPSDTASSFYGETGRVQPDRAGFSGIAKAVAESE